VEVPLEGGGAGGAQGQVAEAVGAGVALPAAGGRADGARGWDALAGGAGGRGGGGDRSGGVGLIGWLAGC
jgi:hypothetical protein